MVLDDGFSNIKFDKNIKYFFIINKKGEIAYQGAIDSIASASQSDIKRAKNYVEMAIEQILENQKVTITKTNAYGCSVKY